MNAILLRSMLLLSAVCVPSVALGAPASGDKLVIEAGRILTQAGDEIENGVIVIENGRITAIGKSEDVKKPWDAPVIGGPDRVAFPGFVEAHTSMGMDRANENVDVAPFLDVRDSVDPVSFYFEDCLRYGVTTVNVQHGNDCAIGAQGMIVRPVGLTVEEMLVRPLFGLKLVAAARGGHSRATQVQMLRQAFDGLKRYLEDLVEKERDERGYAEREALFQGRDLEEEEKKGRAMEGTAWKVEGLELVPRGAIDEKQAPLLDLVEGRRDAFFYCGNAADVGNALELASENGFLAKTTLVIAPACWPAADAIAEKGVRVVLQGALVDKRRDPITGEEEETFVPGVLKEKGVDFALSSLDGGPRSLWYQAALAVGLGLDRAEALKAVTTEPAGILGLGKDIGSLEVGKLGNVLLLSGDPLSITSWVEEVVVEGKKVYDRSEDVRNRHLLEGIRPPGTAAAASVSADEEVGEEAESDEDAEKREEKP